MVLIEPEDADRPILRTEQILQVIDDNASRAVLVILPAIQYYTGQYFDIERITTHAHSKGLFIGWDCAHAVGNVDLQLHGWDVDFAVWCHYKYVNSGPGAMGGLFVHERHGEVSMVVNKNEAQYRPRLTGWWGHDKSTRFLMDNSMVHVKFTLARAWLTPLQNLSPNRGLQATSCPIHPSWILVP
jgi:kynureninase